MHTPHERITDLADQILERLKSKSNKNYPPGTVLVVNCVPNSHILEESDWNDAIERVTKAQVHLPFREVFLLETVMSHSTTIYGDRKRRRKPK
jgi:pseudouridine-5'-phosphate glycosidase